MGSTVIRLGRISYMNMAPAFYRVEAEYDEVLGVPTELNRARLDGEIDVRYFSNGGVLQTVLRRLAAEGSGQG